MSNQIALVTANFGSFDSVKPLPVNEEIESFYYCDEKTHAASSPEAVASWTRVIVPNYPRHDFAPRLRSRYFKHQIHRLDQVRDHRWLVWSDSSIRFKETRFLVEACRELEGLPPSQRALMLPHPQRKTVREEYEYIAAKIRAGSSYHAQRYASEKMPEQMAHFRERGWSVEAPLFCGTIWIIENAEPFRRCWDDWWDQNIRFGLMDQLSLGIVLAARNLEPRLAAFSLIDNPHFEVESHTEAPPAWLKRLWRRLRAAP